MFPDTQVPDERAALAVSTFSGMAELVGHNASRGFGGAFAVIPPGDGEPVTLLLLDNAQSPAMFWSSLKTKIDMALAEIEESERSAGPFGRR
jgi:hypothetical protein